MTDCQIETNEKVFTLHLSGELIVDYAGRLKSLLLDCLKKADRIEIDVALVTGVDVSCLQLFCAAHKTATYMNKSLGLVDVPTGFQQVVRQAGFARSNGCMADRGVRCVWREEKDHE